MILIDNIKMAINSIIIHKLRSSLTMIGIIVGVSSIIIVVGIGRGGEESLKSQIVGKGNTLDILYSPSQDEIQQNPSILNETAFKSEDLDYLREIEEIHQLVTSSSEYGEVTFQKEKFDALIVGISASYFDVNSIEILEGNNVNPLDFNKGRREVLLSEEAAKELFDKNPAIGQIIRIKGEPYTVLGVFNKGTSMLDLGSNEILIPWESWRTLFLTNDFSKLTIKANNSTDLQIAGEKAAKVLNERNNTENTYQVLNMEEIAAGVGSITRVMTLIIGGIASISLLVGGVGVMNIMLVSVTERTREIGIRKSLGATRRDILIQFLTESAIITLMGGAIGIFFGTGVLLLISTIAGWPFLLSIKIIIGSMLFSVLVGVIFGLLPANKAAKLSPIECLRYE